jgi:hypothetical protein
MYWKICSVNWCLENQSKNYVNSFLYSNDTLHKCIARYRTLDNEQYWSKVTEPWLKYINEQVCKQLNCENIIFDFKSGFIKIVYSDKIVCSSELEYEEKTKFAISLINAVKYSMSGNTIN